MGQTVGRTPDRYNVHPSVNEPRTPCSTKQLSYVVILTLKPPYSHSYSKIKRWTFFIGAPCICVLNRISADISAHHYAVQLQAAAGHKS